MRGFRRYAVYYAPPAGSALETFGAAWLGWDAAAGVDVAGLHMPGLAVQREVATTTPRKYGFHGTIKAPFRLRDGVTSSELDRALAVFCTAWPSIELPPLVVTAIGPFLALTPATECPALDALAADCVRDLDQFRAPLTVEEVAKRQAGGLDAVGMRYLEDWGYPHIFDRFRFHLTLTGPLDAAAQAAVAEALTRQLALVLAEPMAVSELCLFGERADGRFQIVRRHGLGPPAAAPR